MFTKSLINGACCFTNLLKYTLNYSASTVKKVQMLYDMDAIENGLQALKDYAFILAHACNGLR